MPDSATLITAALVDEEGVSEDEVTNPDVLRHRRRCKRHLLRTTHGVWFYRDWPWRQTLDGDTITIPGGQLPSSTIGHTEIDSSFASNAFGKACRPSLTQNPQHLPPLTWVPQATMNYLYQVEQRQGPPNRYSVFGEQTAGDGARKDIWVYPIPTVDTNIAITAERIPPSIGDSSDPGETDQDEILLIPEQYHWTVLYEGLVLRLMKDKGSEQTQIQAAIYKQGLTDMVIQERPGREASHRIVPFGMGGFSRLR